MPLLTPSQALPPATYADLCAALAHLRYAYVLRECRDLHAAAHEAHARALLAVSIGQLPCPAHAESLDDDVAWPPLPNGGC